jgi:hypothetical protein
MDLTDLDNINGGSPGASPGASMGASTGASSDAQPDRSEVTGLEPLSTTDCTGSETRVLAMRDRRRCTLPRGRRAIGARWYRRGDWRNELSDLATGGMSRSSQDSRVEDWPWMTAAGAIGLVAGTGLAIGAIRLGLLPSEGPVPMIVAALAFAASGAFALVACCAEIDDATDDRARRD